MFWFILASFSPAVLLAVAVVLGGFWPAVALVWISLFVALIDRLGGAVLSAEGGDVATARRLNVALGVTHLLLLPGLVWAMARAPWLTASDGIALFFAGGLYLGQVGNSNAHELIHAAARGPRRLGVAVYTALLFGHHASSHPLVHHVHVATDRDPNSAPKGQGFWRFWLRAWLGSFRAGLSAENARRARLNGRSAGPHPYWTYCLGGAAALALGWALGGPAGLVAWLLLAIYAQMQLILSDYVQHYGLRRVIGPDGRPEPVGPRHSWNASPWFSAAMMLNAPRHSDHHAHPGRAFPALRLEPWMPMLPRSLPVMGALALVPPLWRRVMDRRVDRWQRKLPGGMRRADLAGSSHDPIRADSALPAGPARAG